MTFRLTFEDFLHAGGEALRLGFVRAVALPIGRFSGRGWGSHVDVHDRQLRGTDLVKDRVLLAGHIATR